MGVQATAGSPPKVPTGKNNELSALASRLNPSETPKESYSRMSAPKPFNTLPMLNETVM